MDGLRGPGEARNRASPASSVRRRLLSGLSNLSPWELLAGVMTRFTRSLLSHFSVPITCATNYLNCIFSFKTWRRFGVFAWIFPFCLLCLVHQHPKLFYWKAQWLEEFITALPQVELFRERRSDTMAWHPLGSRGASGKSEGGVLFR